MSIKLLMNLMRVTALRHSPIGFGMLFRTDPTLTAAWVAPCQNDPRIRRELARLLRNVAKTDLTDVASRLPRFTKPVTVVWGMLDRSFTPALGRRLVALFPDATWVEVPDAPDVRRPGRPAGGGRRDQLDHRKDRRLNQHRANWERATI